MKPSTKFSSLLIVLAATLCSAQLSAAPASRSMRPTPSDPGPREESGSVDLHVEKLEVSQNGAIITPGRPPLFKAGVPITFRVTIRNRGMRTEQSGAQAGVLTCSNGMMGFCIEGGGPPGFAIMQTTKPLAFNESQVLTFSSVVNASDDYSAGVPGFVVHFRVIAP